VRENKFRGKRKDNGKWTYGDLIQLLGEQGGGRKFIVDNRFGACIDENGDFLNTEAPFVNEVDPKTIGQFIGFTDKNGREIYGRDLVEDENGIGEVEWVQEHCSYLVFTRNPSQYHRLESDGQLSRTAVIGNAIDNPELLEV
jgi:uncharacterized phage protein (TIGR01671 family)